MRRENAVPHYRKNFFKKDGLCKGVYSKLVIK